jgi:hypothetical protein
VCRGGAEAVKDLPKVLTHSVFQKHVALDADLTAVLRARVVEVRFVCFSSDTSVEEKETVSTNVRRGINEYLDECADVSAVSVGWSLENDFPVLRDGETSGIVGAVLAVFVGWSGIEAQKEFRREHRERDEVGRSGEMNGMIGSFATLIECRQFGKSRE